MEFADPELTWCRAQQAPGPAALKVQELLGSEMEMGRSTWSPNIPQHIAWKRPGMFSPWVKVQSPGAMAAMRPVRSSKISFLIAIEGSCLKWIPLDPSSLLLRVESFPDQPSQMEGSLFYWKSYQPSQMSTTLRTFTGACTVPILGQGRARRAHTVIRVEGESPDASPWFQSFGGSEAQFFKFYGSTW